MASQLSDLTAEVKDRLNIGTGGAQPSDVQIDGFVESAVKSVLASLPPVFELTGTVSAELTLVVPDSRRILFVQVRDHILLDSEWMRDASLPGVRLLGYRVVGPGEAITVYYTKNHDTASELGSATPQVETSCIFGADWLEELFLSAATMAVLRYMTKRHGSAGGSMIGSIWRVEMDREKELYARLRDVWNGWNEELRVKQQERAALAPPVHRNPLAGRIQVMSRRINKLTGRP